MDDKKKEDALSQGLYMQHRLGLQQAMHDQARSFDGAILTLSSGAIALSIAFLDKIARILDCPRKCLLGTTWISFVLAILCILASFVSSQKAHKALIDEWDWTFQNQKNCERKLSNKYDRYTRWLNYASATFFCIGVVVFVVLALVSVPQSRSTS